MRGIEPYAGAYSAAQAHERRFARHWRGGKRLRVDEAAVIEFASSCAGQVLQYNERKF
jgi:hypothetical protein